ncbi:MAG: hypothetical protein WAM85_10115 [Terracidiphilus sp.]
MMLQDHLRLTREELYDLVWAKPVTQVAHQFEISDRAMAKICAKKQVPVPPRGYWAKKSAGKDVPAIPLPEFVTKPPKEKNDKVIPAQETAKNPKLHSVFDERHQTIRKALKQFRNALAEAIDYTVRIDGWNCDYSFGLNASYDPLHRDNEVSFLFEAPYSEHRDLVLRGVFLEPKKVREKKLEVRFVRKPHLEKRAVKENLHRYEESPPRSVGGFMKQGNYIMAYLSIPEDAFALVLQNAIAGKIRFMTLRGPKMRYGSGKLFHYYIQEEQDES